MCVLTIICLTNLYVSAEVQAAQPVVKTNAYELRQMGDIRPELFEGPWCADHYCKGPVGEMRVGLRLELPERWRAEVGVVHRSYITEGDRGYEVPFIKIEWRPFK